jgi:predicted nucleotidyltransferase
MIKPYEPIIQEVLAQLQEELDRDLLGVLLVGSLASGTPRPQSDIDLFAVIRPPWRQRRTFLVQNVQVELFLNPLHHIQAEFQHPSDATMLRMLVQGRVLLDTEGIVAQLVQEAQQIWNQPRPAIDPRISDSLLYAPVELLKDAQDLLAVDEEAAFGVMVAAALRAALDVYYRVQRRWPAPSKELLHDLEQHDPEMGRLVRQVLSCKFSIHERCAALSTFIDRVLEPLGGRLTEWQTPKESVEEKRVIP